MEKTLLYITKLLGMNFSNEITALIDKKASIAQFSRGDIIVHEGDIAAHAYLIINGIVRGYYIGADGNDISKCFSVEGEFFHQKVSCCRNLPLQSSALKIAFALNYRMISCTK